MVIHQTSEQLHGYVLLWLKQWHTQIINASCPCHPDHVLPHIFSHSCLPLFLMARPPGVAGHSEIRSSMWSVLFRFLLRRVIWILLGQSLSCCWYFFSNFQWTFFLEYWFIEVSFPTVPQRWPLFSPRNFASQDIFIGHNHSPILLYKISSIRLKLSITTARSESSWRNARTLARHSRLSSLVTAM